VQVRIGVVHSPRDIEVDVAEDAGAAATAAIEKALGGDSPLLWLTDRRGRRVAVVSERISFVEITSDAGERRVGFSAI
jgi:hypothetical protein